VLLSFLGSVLALWPVRERKIERVTLVGSEFEVEPGSGGPEPDAGAASGNTLGESAPAVHLCAQNRRLPLRER